MELKHFSHDHPLKLQEDKKDEDEAMICSCCEEQISGPHYSCIDCEFFLHKKCAKLPQEIKHPMHQQHKLTFKLNPKFSSFLCNGCKTSNVGFNYICSLCRFNLCISCSCENQTFNHPLHEHPLILLKRSASFHCDACDQKQEDLSYKCTTCPFWIHRSCGLLEEKTVYACHKHPLTMGQTIPETFSKYIHDCAICKNELNASYWVYYCAKCRYVAHLKCTTSSPLPEEAFGDTKTEDEQEDSKTNLKKFPPHDDEALVKLFTHYINKMTAENTPRQTEITNWSHEHPLILTTSAQDNNDIIKNNRKTLCDGCVQPICTPFYTCKDCSYFLHRSCAGLPKIFTDQSSAYSSLTATFLGKPQIPLPFVCYCCGIYSNGFFYDSLEGARLDIKCASMQDFIFHRAHNHPLYSINLVNMLFQPVRPSGNCNSCGKNTDQSVFKCYDCGFNLDRRCFLLPQIVRHRWDPHPIPLRYPPFDDHPDEFYCDICEEEMDPLKWLYHCTECDQSFHPDCIRPFDKYSNVKFGGTFKMKNHPHPLKYVRFVESNDDDEPSSSCNRCGKWPKDDTALECAPCKFLLCQTCISCTIATDDIWASQDVNFIRVFYKH